jgi:aspartate kinase
MGASVLHDEAVFPVRKAGIPVNIRNTNDPEAAGSLIVSPDAANVPVEAGCITGVAGRKDFTVIAIEKAMMNSELGFGRRALAVLEEQGVNWEHVPTGIDTLSIVVSDKEIAGKLVSVVDALRKQVDPDNVEVFPNMALIATVGRGMMQTKGMAAQLFAALAKAEVNIRMIDQGSSELNIIVGVEAEQYEVAVEAIYEAFVP